VKAKTPLTSPLRELVRQELSAQHISIAEEDSRVAETSVEWGSTSEGSLEENTWDSLSFSTPSVERAVSPVEEMARARLRTFYGRMDGIDDPQEFLYDVQSAVRQDFARPSGSGVPDFLPSGS
jgi:hypothetical protein